MSDLRTAAQQALEALETPIHEQSFMQKQNAITALEAALAEPVQEPVAYVDQRIHGWPDCFVMEANPPHTTPLYAAPPQRPAQPAGVVTSMVKGGVTWHVWPDQMPDGTTLYAAAPIIKPEIKEDKPVPPPEAQTEAEKIAYCAGWWAALAAERKELLRISEKQQ